MKAKEMLRLIEQLESEAMEYAYRDADMERSGDPAYKTARDEAYASIGQIWTAIHAGLAEGVGP